MRSTFLRHRLFDTAAAVAVLCLFAGTAVAQQGSGEHGHGQQEPGQQESDSAQDSTDLGKAQAYYQKGVAAFFKKKYSLAVTYFQRANALDPDPVVLYNISISYSKIGNVQKALHASVDAEHMGGLPADTAVKNEARIVAYRRILAARGLQEVIVAAEAPAALPRPKAPRADNHLSGVGWAGVSTAAVGAAALIGAGVTTYIVRGNVDDYDAARAAGRGGRAQTLQADIHDRQSLGRVLLYSGAGLVAVGGALWAIDFFGSPETANSARGSGRAAIVGAAGPGGASVQLRGAF